MAKRISTLLLLVLSTGLCFSCASTGKIQVTKDSFDNSSSLQLEFYPAIENGNVYLQFFQLKKHIDTGSAAPTSLTFYFYSYNRLKLNPVNGKININNNMFDVEIQDMDNYLSAPSYRVDRLSESDAAGYRQKYIVSNMKGRIILDSDIENELLAAQTVKLRLFTQGAAYAAEDFITLRLTKEQVEIVKKFIARTRE